MLLPPVSAARLRRADLYAALRAAVLDGILAPGERLPSSRQAAADYGVSGGMLEEVFSSNPAGMHLIAAHERGGCVTALRRS
jgi:GntR family transcriptional regulator/MocR family aminotransferase